MRFMNRRPRVAILCSHRAPALRHLLEPGSSRMRSYDVVACLTSEESFEEEELVRAHGIPILFHPLRRFCSTNGWKVSDQAARTTFDELTRRRLSWFDIDIVVLDAYLYLLSSPMLNAYDGRIVNIHHSDLLDRTPAGRPRFPGLRAVRDAILAGARETRSTVHLVTADVDDGAALVRSWPFPVAPLVARARAWGAMDILKAYAYAHQEWMIRATWGPLVDATLSLIADGRLDLAAIAGHAAHVRFEPFELEESGGIHSGPAVNRAFTDALALVG